MISKVGHDDHGMEIIEYLKSSGVDTSPVLKDVDYGTGVVNVMINEKGNASYDILYPSAWDKIEVSDTTIKPIKEADAIVYGSLVCRDSVSRGTLINILDNAKYKILDINLRPPYYTEENLVQLMDYADFIKFNDEELYEISNALGSRFNSLEQNMEFIASKTNTDTICVTMGGHGAVLYDKGIFYHHSGYYVKVVDTVGAGDSFLATLVANLLKGMKPQESLNTACAVGALVAGSEGANPKITDSRIKEFMFPR